MPAACPHAAGTAARDQRSAEPGHLVTAEIAEIGFILPCSVNLVLNRCGKPR